MDLDKFSGRLDRAPVAGLPDSKEGFPDFRENRPRDGALESGVEPEGGFDAILHDVAEQNIPI
jgi:hypothetical protein